MCQSLLFLRRPVRHNFIITDMLQYASREVKAQLKMQKEKSLGQIQQQTQDRMKRTLKFMQEWTNDLMERESEMQEVRRQLLEDVGEGGESGREGKEIGLDVEGLIREEFFNKMEDLYSKQLLVANLPQTDRGMCHEESVQDSLNHSGHNQTFSQEHELEEGSIEGMDRY